MQHAYANVNGISLHYVVEGAGPLVLFLHGFPEFWYAWRGQIEEFGKAYMVVAPDLRGFNLSSKPSESVQYRLDLLVEDVRTFIDHLGHKKCILVAYDWGGVIAWAFAAIYPEYLEKLVVISAPHPAMFGRELLRNERQRQASAYMNFLCTPDAEMLLAANNFSFLFQFAHTVGGAKWLSLEERPVYLEALRKPGALTGMLNYYRATSMRPPTDDMTRSTLLAAAWTAKRLKVVVPTLVIWGGRDKVLTPALLDGLGQYVSDLTIHNIPDGSHWVVHEKSEEINHTIHNYIK